MCDFENKLKPSIIMSQNPICLADYISLSTSGLFLRTPVLLKAKLSLKYFYFTQKMKSCNAKWWWKQEQQKKIGLIR